VDFGELDVPSFQRVRESSPPSVDWMFRNGSAGVLAFMALEGIGDIREGCEKYAEAYVNYLHSRADLLGVSPEEFIRDKLNALRRKHSLALNQRPTAQFDPVKNALARSYRKGRDGE
jgi:hypothetical protein